MSKPFDLIKLFLPNYSIEYTPIGSRVYLPNPPHNSDHDFMFHSYDRDNVVNHLDSLGVSYKVGAIGSIKFNVSISDLWTRDINFCFIEHYREWEKATSIMSVIFKDTRMSTCIISKKERMKLFKRIVEELGGKGVLLPNFSS